MAIILATPPLKLEASQSRLPARNTNLVGLTKDKIGPSGIAFDAARRRWRMWVEGVSGVQVGPGGFDYFTAPFHASAAQLQGPWEIGGAPGPIITPEVDPNYENGEISFGTVYYHGSLGKWVATGHVGNNSQARRIYLFWSTDRRGGMTWERDAGNPIISEGTAGAFDDASVADLKWVVKPGTSTVIGLYAGRAALGNQPTIGRATSTLGNLASWTKTGEVVALAGAPAWRAGGAGPGGLYYDENGRLHMWMVGYTAGNIGSIGCLYSDDDGATWTDTSITNPVLSAGADGAYDELAGDVVQGVADGDVYFFLYGGSSDNYGGAGGSPYDNPAGAIVPLAREVRIKTGKFHPATSPRSETAMTGTSLTTQATSSVLVRFRAYRLSTTREYRHFYGEYGASFDRESYFRIEGGAGADAGKVVCFVRTPTGFASLASTGTVDDGGWHRMLYRRTGTAAHELWIDGVQVDSDSTNIGTDATVTSKYVGNNGDTGVNEPSLCTVSDVVTIVGTAVTWAQAEAIFATRSFPAGVSAAVDFPTSLGTDGGSPVLVEAADLQAAAVAVGDGPDAGVRWHRPKVLMV